jgi:glycosyltransferase involved in cell wall biosynthesis
MGKLKRLKFTAPFFDPSGYGKASRQNALAMHKMGVELTLNPISFEKNKPSIGEDGELLRSLVNRFDDYDAHFIQLTPEHFPIYQKKTEKTIAFTVWENDRLFPTWPGFINTLDKVITGSEWGKKVFEDSGVTIPVGVCSHCADDVPKNIDNYKISGLSDDTFVFGDIFQWVEKKNPGGLLKTYWATFKKEDNVALVLKTYRNDFSDVEKNVIRDTIKRMKNFSPLDYYPPIYLILDMLSDNQVKALHSRFDCYISLDKGEGVGIGPLTAGSFGKPIILTGWGGSTEYAKPDNSYLVDFTKEFAFGMPYSPWHRGDQMWANADQEHASRLMREVFENQAQAKEKGLKLQSYIRENFSYEAIGKRLISEIEEVL